jgi:Predicted membrane protein
MTPHRILLAAVFFWCAAITATPFLASHDGAASVLASFSYRFFSHVCHQLDSRSFHVDGNKFAVCIRCFSIYTTFFLGIVFFPKIERTKLAAVSPRVLLAFSALPMAIDVALAGLGISESTVLTRIVTGSLFGLALSIILTPDLEEIVSTILLQLKNISRTYYAAKTR